MKTREQIRESVQETLFNMGIGPHILAGITYEKLTDMLTDLTVGFEQLDEAAHETEKALFTGSNNGRCVLCDGPSPKGQLVKKITYTRNGDVMRIYIDGLVVAGFRCSTELEGEAHLRAFCLGVRWGRNDEFDPTTKLTKEHKRSEPMSNFLSPIDEYPLLNAKTNKEKTMFVLVGEFEGDYDDYYERPTETIACSKSKEKLDTYWETVKSEWDCIGYRIEPVVCLDNE